MKNLTLVLIGESDEVYDDTVTRKPSKGEYGVGITFNPGGHEGVNHVKRCAADLIDYLEMLQLKSANPEVKRLCALAQTDIETAAMHAVKAITKPVW